MEGGTLPPRLPFRVTRGDKSHAMGSKLKQQVEAVPRIYYLHLAWSTARIIYSRAVGEASTRCN